MSAPPTSKIDAVHLVKMRILVARFGEMDGAGWWNTRGVLGRIGKAGLSRGFPATHYFAQARIVFAVAAARCKEVFSPPGCYTLWSLPPEVEETVDAHWQSWCRAPSDWEPFFAQVSDANAGNLLDSLIGFRLAENSLRAEVAALQISAQGKAVQLPRVGSPDSGALTLLAATFARGAKGNLIVPYMRGE